MLKFGFDRRMSAERGENVYVIYRDNERFVWGSNYFRIYSIFLQMKGDRKHSTEKPDIPVFDV